MTYFHQDLKKQLGEILSNTTSIGTRTNDTAISIEVIQKEPIAYHSFLYKKAADRDADYKLLSSAAIENKIAVDAA